MLLRTYGIKRRRRYPDPDCQTVDWDDARGDYRNVFRETVYCNLVTPSIRQLTCAPRAIKQAQRLQIKALTENQALRHV